MLIAQEETNLRKNYFTAKYEFMDVCMVVSGLVKSDLQLQQQKRLFPLSDLSLVTIVVLDFDQ